MSCGYCDGNQTELRRRVIKGGSIQFLHQCLTCGRAVSTARPKSTIRNPNATPAWDDTLNDRYERSLRAQGLAEQDLARATWFREHNAYLKTPEWRARRLAVLKRANGICEGCAGAVATQVHHLTYEHWKCEFLWELVAVCDGCHEAIHAHMTEGRS